MKKIYLLLVFESLFGLLHSQTLLDSLIAYYPFSGNSNDVSGNNNNATSYGAMLTNDRFGNANSAYFFNGTSNYMTVSAGPKFKPTTFPISICCWIKTNGTSVEEIFENDHTALLYNGVWLQLTSGHVAISYGTGTGNTGSQYRRTKTGNINVADNQWHFIAGVIRGATDMDIWVDCNMDNGTYSGTGGNMGYDGSNGRIGEAEVASGNFYYTGSLDEIRFYHRELHQSDILALQNQVSAISLGVDQSFCPSGNPITLTPTITGTPTSLLWSTNSTANSITVTSPGTYWVSAIGSCATIYDSINISGVNNVNASPAFICSNSSMLLNSLTASSYSWSPNFALSCSTCQSPVASPLVNVVYTCVANTGLCSNVQTFPVNIYQTPNLISL